MITKDKNYTYISVLKIFAIFQILYFHNGVYFAEYYGQSGYWLYTAVTMLAYSGVPLFFTISGALLLNKEESFKKLFTHRILRYAVVLTLISAVCYVYENRFNLSALSIRYYIDGLMTFSHSSYLWYMYAYIAFLFMLPFLRKLAVNMSREDYIYLFVIYLIFKSASVFQFFAWRDNAIINQDFKVAFFASLDVFIYPLLGYFLQHRLKEKDFNSKNISLMLIIGLVGLIAETVLTDIKLKSGSESPEPLTQFGYTYACLFVASIFFVCRGCFIKHSVSDKTSKTLLRISECVFGVYLIQEILVDITRPAYIYLQKFLPVFPSNIIWLLISLVLGFALTFLIRLIPIVKKFI